MANGIFQHLATAWTTARAASQAAKQAYIARHTPRPPKPPRKIEALRLRPKMKF